MSHQSLHSIIAHIAETDPARPALVTDQTSYDYAAIRQLTGKISSNLRVLLPTGDIPILVLLPRSADMILAFAGCLQAGRRYIPVDPSQPESYLVAIMQQSAARLVITDADHLDLCRSQGLEPVMMPDLLSGEAQPAVSGDQNGGFVLYTSGTTGQPKGVCLTETAMLRGATEIAQILDINEGSHCLHFAAPGFDSASLEMILTLSAGACLYLAPDQSRADPQSLMGFLESQEISHAILPAALLPYLPDNCPESLQAMVIAGDVCPEPILWRWAENCRLFNGYGPSEITVCASLTEVRPGEPVSIGNALPSVKIHLEPNEDGLSELWLGGAQLFSGYLGRPDLDQLAFVTDPQGQTWYRTGDLVRQDEKDRLIFAGRSDHQVKLGGSRVELDAIRSCLTSLSQVEDAELLALPEKGAQKKLYAFIAGNADEASLRQELARRFPASHMPANFHFMSKLPVTANGKTDRHALADLATSTEPQGDLAEDPVKQIYCAELGLKDAGEDSHFFDLGGNSVGQIRLIDAVGRELNVWIRGQDFRTDPTLAGLRKLVAQADQETSGRPIHRSPHQRGETLPLTPQQKAAWFLHSSTPDSKAYLAEAAIWFEGSFSPDAMETALNRLFDRHDIYRTIFWEEAGEPVQKVCDSFTLKLNRFDCREVPESERKQCLRGLFKSRLPGIPDLSQLPLARFLLVCFADDLHVLMHQEHHIIHDGWSGSRFSEEMLRYYADALPDGPAYQPADCPQYLDFAHSQDLFLRSDEGEKQLEFWRQQLAGCPQGVALFGKQSRGIGFEGASQRMVFSRAQWERMEAACRNQGVTSFAYASAVLFLSLARFSGQRDIAFGSAFANRNWAASHDILGMMVNTIVLRQQLPDEGLFWDFVRQVGDTITEAQSHEEYPFGELVARLNPDRMAGANPYFNVLLGFHDTPIQADLPEGVSWRKDETVESSSSKFDLDCLVVPRPNGFNEEDEVHFLWEYRSDIFAAEEIEIFLAGYRHLFESGLENDLPLSELSGMAPVTTDFIIDSGLGRQTPPPQSTMINSLTAIATEAAERIALQDANGQLSYGEMLAQAQKLAVALREATENAGGILAIHQARGNDLVCSMLASWMADMTVLVLDPDLPEARLNHILEEAAPAALLDEAGELQLLSPKSPSPELAEGAAYIIYTSGSTGKPKGVVVGHESFANLCQFHRDTFQLDDSTVGVALAHPGFDAYMAEIWPVLLAGGRLISVSDQDRSDMEMMAGLFQQHSVSHCCLSTGLFEAALAIGFTWADSLKTVLTGGDRLGPISLPPNRSWRLFNMYGPTETTVDALYQELEGSNHPDAPAIGRPIANARALILNEEGQLCPPGAEGALWIGGACLARGYLGQPDLTADRFQELDPGKAELKGRYYKTGDQARWNKDGRIEYLGRLDDEVKIRGYRIDLGEITNRLLENSKVSQAACISHTGSLIAYAVPAEKELADLLAGRITAQKLSRYLSGQLRKYLPDYMRPSQVMILDSLPLTDQGKLDRRALPLPEMEKETFQRPETETETLIAGIWSDMLEGKEISVTENFFSIGGHSLLAIKIISRIAEKTGVKMKLEDFFTYFSVRDQARFVAAAQIPEGSFADAGEIVEEGSL